jgi:hypothetical protein
VKITIILLVLTVTLFFVVGCGPGEPFEIEGMHTSNSEAPSHIVAAK